MEQDLPPNHSGDLYKTMVDNAPVMLWVALPDRKRHAFNCTWLKFTGRTLEQEQGEGWTAGIHPDDVCLFREHWSLAFDSHTAFGIEYRLRRHDGTYRWVLERGTPQHSTDGTFHGFTGSCTDIDHLMEGARATGHEVVAVQAYGGARDIVSNAPFPIAVYIGKEMRIVEANRAIMDVWGKGYDVIGKRYADVLPELGDQQIYEQLEGVYTTGRPFSARNQRVDLRVNGELKTFYFNYKFTPLHDQAGKVCGVMNTAEDVTDIVLLKQRIEENQKTLYNLILQAPVAMCFMTGLDHIVEVANTAMINLWGRPQEEVLGKPVFDGFPGIQEEGLKQWIDHVYRTGETYRASEQPIMLLREGKIDTVYQDIVYQAYRDGSDRIIGVIAIITDVSTQVKAKQELERAHEKYRLSKEAAQLGMFDLDIQTGRLEWDDRCRELFGIYHDREVSYEEDFVYGLHPDDRKRVMAVIHDALYKDGTDGNCDIEYRTIGKSDNKERWVRAKGKVYFDPHGNPMRLIGSVLDITEQKHNEQRLQESIERKARLGAIVETSDDAIVSKTLQGIITSWNKAAQRILGYTPEEAIGRHISLIIPPSRLAEEEYIISEIRAGRKVDHFNTVRLTKDGREISLSITVSPLFDDVGNIIGASKIARDISAHVKAQQVASRYTERLEIINSMVRNLSEELDLNKTLQKLTDGTTTLTGAAFGAFFYNKRDSKQGGGQSHVLYTLSGAPREAFEHFSMPRGTAVLHPTFSGERAVRVDDITKDPRYGQNAPHYGMPEGHLPVVSYLAVPVASRSGEVIGGLFLGHPEPSKFTEDHEHLVVSIAAQAAIALDNAKLYEEVKALNDRKNEFIGFASHELKTPLTSANAYLQLLEKLPADEKSKYFIQKALRQMKKLTTLVNDLLDISKIEAGKLQLNIDEFDLKKVMEETIELIGHTNDKYRIVFDTAVDSCMIRSDSQHVEQVLVNLLTNAIKYSPEADEVRVTLECSEDNVKVGVQDFGRGIPSTDLPHIFSRFYRAGNVSQNTSGLGIGLYLCNEIITRLNGSLWAESTVGLGSTFWFTLPINK